jgi:hypothetical protein
MVTDPVVGHLLDYGRRTPFCTDTTRLQMDHAEEFPDGPSTTANCGTHSIRCHQLKTNGYADITDSRADGSYVWTTLWADASTSHPGRSSRTTPTRHRSDGPVDVVGVPLLEIDADGR